MGKQTGKDTETSKPKKKLRFGSGSIIALFDKTPEPKKPSDVICPHFWELKYANGCKYDCQWCFLNGTFRYQERGKAPYLKKETTIDKDIRKALQKIEEPTLFNAGEVSDGLVYPGTMLNTVIPLFRDEHTNPHGHKLLILTKSADTRSIAHAGANKSVIFAWSLNAIAVAQEWELHAPDPTERLRAARYAIEQGYEVRLRIDPMVPIERWDRHYKRIVKEIMKWAPWTTVITLGSLRGLQSTITACKKKGKDTSWTDYLTDKTNWGLRVPKETRVEMYQLIINELRKEEYDGHIALCKESQEIWKELGLDPKETKCNCTL